LTFKNNNYHEKFQTILRYFISSILIGCNSTIPMNKEFYNHHSNIGVISIVDSITVVKKGSQGILDMALTSNNRYKKVLKTIEPDLNPQDEILSQSIKIISTLNKTPKIIDEKLTLSNYDNFKKESPEKSKKYFKKDLRELKSKYKIDELAVINTSYGLSINYYGVIETGKDGFANINVTIIDLNDNSILYSENTYSANVLAGKWNTPPQYDNLKSTIKQSIENVISEFPKKILQQ
jgi:hypothetical protein